MSEKYLSALWSAIAPSLANHLWQSTLVAALAGLLTLALRKHHARARYWLWLAASIKFLIPFSLLVRLGSLFAWARPARTTSTGLSFAIEEVSQPFSQVAVRATTAHSATVVAPTLPQLLPVLTIVWLCGFLTVLLVWIIRWRRISAVMKSATPLNDGREVGALRRMEHIAGIRKPIELLLSQASLEPGIFGIARPALIWPEGISGHLEDRHLEAVLAHEVWHVRRRDNLSAALHMLVEAVFWFYPPVWWLGARLLEERERSCDEQVVALGSERQIYAESILKVCEFCLGSPLPCVAGVTGADLKKRMVHIMTDRILHKLDFARKALLTLAAALAIAIPVTFGLFNATPGRAQSQAENAAVSGPAYSSVSVKPSDLANGESRTRMMFSLMDGTFVANGVTLEKLIQMAYHAQEAQISGPRDFLNKTKYDIEAKVDPSQLAAMKRRISEHPGSQDQGMLRKLLADQFKLVVHYETRTVAAYDLIADDGGAKLQPSGSQQRMFHIGRGEFTSSGAPLQLLAEQLSARLGRPVVDKTGLKENYAFTLHWTPDPSEEEHLAHSGEPVAPEPVPDANGPSLTNAVEEQLGLKLQANTEPVQVLVIDHAEMPSGN